MGKISSPPMANPAEDTAGGVALLLATPAYKNFQSESQMYSAFLQCI